VNEQLDFKDYNLFDAITGTPRARNTDPVTSHIAAARAREFVQSQRKDVLDYVNCFWGLTSAELAWEYAGRRHDAPDRWKEFRPMFARRLPEMVPRYIRRGDIRVCDQCQSPCVTWWPK